MKHSLYAFLFGLLICSFVGCSKSGGDPVTPVNTNADLLARQWNFTTITVKTDAKSYAVIAPILGDNGVLTFAKGGNFSYLDGGKTVSGKWTLADDKTLTLIDADNETTTWTVNTVNSTNVELASSVVNVTKSKDLTDTKVYSPQEQLIAQSAVLLLASIDKANGGTVDFSKEPTPKSLQLILGGKAQ